jgi:hypothetical protein
MQMILGHLLRRLRPCFVLFAALAGLGLGARAPAVVINEIHYDPPEGRDLEFVELYNPSAAAVAVGGWRFARGLRFELPPSTVIPAGGYLLVCRSRELVARRFGLRLDDRLVGNYASSLDNRGETLTLLDAEGVLVDEVEYENQPPWDAAAAGRGASLERLCATFDSRHPANWAGDPGRQPTPLAANSRTLCPPPLGAPPLVAISEIYYHPLEDRDAEEEFVELINASAEAVNLRGWSFTSGIRFTFSDDLILAPGEAVAVCRNQAALRSRYPGGRMTGDFEGQLSNDGERLTLVDAGGRLADSVRYADSGDWPVLADGLGHSLEKIVPAAPSDDPASWSASQRVVREGWQHQGASGVATSNRLFLYADGEAEFLLDNFRLVDPAEPEVNLLPNGSFDEGIEGWAPRGNHADSRWDSSGGPDGSGALRLLAAGRGSGASQGIAVDTIAALQRNTVSYELSFDYLHVSGNLGLTVRLSGASNVRGVYFKLGEGAIISPGAPNGARREALPPFIDAIGRHPRQPGSQDPIAIHARVRGEEVGRVTLLVSFAGAPAEAVEMRDDGASGDGRAGDGVYGVILPPQPHGTSVTFRIEAESAAGGVRVSPPAGDPTGVHGLYVNDAQPASPLPVYTLIIDPHLSLTPRAAIDRLNCGTYRSAGFAVGGDLYANIGIRHRGQSVCGSFKKYLKVRFQRGREFQGQRKLNFQSLWTDKSLVREHLAWRAFAEIGNPYCRHEFVRLHVNGRYFGLYAELEHPDKRYLQRNGLNPDGNLYKATASREEASGTYEKKTNENGDFSDLRAFLNQMHATPPAQLVSFFQANTFEDAIIDYQAAQVLTNNRDYPHKNHYLYHDTARGRWMPTTWDMDLTYGKRWDGSFGGVLNDLMDNPGITPWYTTNVAGEGTGNHLLDKFFSQGGAWYRRAYLVRLWDAIHEKYTLEYFEERLAELRELLWDEQLEDFAAWGRSAPTANDPRAPAELDPNLDRVRNHIRLRRDFLLGYLRNRERFTGHDRLKITEVMYNPLGGVDAGEFIELWNSSGTAIDIGGWSIEGLGAAAGDGSRREFVFADGTRIEEGEVFIVAKDPDHFLSIYGPVARVFGPYPGRLSNSGQELRVKDAGPGFPATVDFLRYGSKRPWPERADGLGYSLELTDVHPDRDNDLPGNWRSSLLWGGTPGRIALLSPEPVFFRRGDCNGDGAVNITDAVGILLYLFRGAGSPPCLDGCDIDANGILGIDDAIFLLRYFFVPPSAPIPAPGPGECRPARGGFCERSICEPGEA